MTKEERKVVAWMRARAIAIADEELRASAKLQKRLRLSDEQAAKRTFTPRLRRRIGLARLLSRLADSIASGVCKPEGNAS